MKYKDKYIEAQKRFYTKLTELQGSYSKIRCLIGQLEETIDSRKAEISPELQRHIFLELDQVRTICLINEGYKI